jgi:hypothetical protein
MDFLVGAGAAQRVRADSALDDSHMR